MTDFSDDIFMLDDFRIDIINRQISFDGNLLSLTAKYFDVLIYFIKNNNRLISKNELYLNIWGDPYVTDTALSQCIKDIRKALNDDPKNPQYLKTVPKHGFIFLKEPEIISNKKISQPTPVRFLSSSILPVQILPALIVRYLIFEVDVREKISRVKYF